MLKTRIKDAGDLDLEKVIPYQNYFYNKSIDTEASETKAREVVTEIQVQAKKKQKDLDTGIEKHNTGVKPRKRRIRPADIESGNSCQVRVLKRAKI